MRPVSFPLARAASAAVALGVCLIAADFAPVDAADLEGKPEIVDGDTIDLAGRRLDIAGIDAPEADQTCRRRDGISYPCGQMATFALAGVIETQWVRCTELMAADGGATGTAVCKIGPYDVGAEMVRRGWAVATVTGSVDYGAAQAHAHGMGIGLWQGRFDYPWVWRRR